MFSCCDSLKKSAQTARIEFSNEDSCSLKRSLIKNLALSCVILGCFMVFMNWSTTEIAILGVIVIVLCSWISEAVVRPHGFIPLRGKAVVITGCDSGFGNLLAKHLAERGVLVFAGCLKGGGEGAVALRSYGFEGLHVIQMDVTNEEEVKKCVAYVREKTNGAGVFGIVNNAGINFLGDIELTTMQQFTAVTSVNQLGMVRVTKAFIPDIRRNKGRIVNITSVKGRVAEPFNATYAMTKFAGEAFSDVLRMEMKKFGVSVSIVEPGNFGGATGCLDMERIGNDFKTMWEAMSEDVRLLYGKKYIDHHLRRVEDSIPTASFNLLPVLEAITDALFSFKPLYRYLVPGSSHWYDLYSVKVFLAPLLPSKLLDRWLLGEISNFPDPI